MAQLIVDEGEHLEAVAVYIMHHWVAINVHLDFCMMKIRGVLVHRVHGRNVMATRRNGIQRQMVAQVHVKNLHRCDRVVRVKVGDVVVAKMKVCVDF